MDQVHVAGEEPALSEKNQSIVKYHENIILNAARRCFFCIVEAFHFTKEG